MNNLIWQSAISEILPQDFIHPGLRTVRFVFCDDQPNENNQGIEYTDFAEIQKSAIGAPIKMKFLGQAVGGHHSSIPIGHVKDMFEREVDGVHQLVADGILYANEYPDEVEYLAHSFAEGTSPGLSWELDYNSEKSIVKNGIEWLKGLLTRAATFVRNPAYGNRTAILALASNRDLSAADFMIELAELVKNGEVAAKKAGTSDAELKEPEGGFNNMDEKELQKLKDDLAQALSALAAKETELTAKAEENITLSSENTALKAKVTETESVIAEYSKSELLNTRLTAITEAGIPLETDKDKLEKKKEFYLNLSNESFAEYVEDLKSVAAASTKLSLATAARRTPAFPRFSTSNAEESTSLTDLSSRLGSLSRTPITQ